MDTFKTFRDIITETSKFPLPFGNQKALEVYLNNNPNDALFAKSIDYKKNLETEWVNCFTNDRNILLIRNHILSISSGTIRETEACDSLVRLIHKLSSSEFFLALEFRNLTSSWAKRWFVALLQNLKSVELTAEHQVIINKAIEKQNNWSFCSDFIHQPPSLKPGFFVIRGMDNDAALRVMFPGSKLEEIKKEFKKVDVESYIKKGNIFSKEIANLSQEKKMRALLLASYDLKLINNEFVVIGNSDLSDKLLGFYTALSVVEKNSEHQQFNLFNQAAPLIHLPSSLSLDIASLLEENYKFSVAFLENNTKICIAVTSPEKHSKVQIIVKYLLQELEKSFKSKLTIVFDSENLNIFLTGKPKILERLHILFLETLAVCEKNSTDKTLFECKIS